MDHRPWAYVYAFRELPPPASLIFYILGEPQEGGLVSRGGSYESLWVAFQFLWGKYEAQKHCHLQTIEPRIVRIRRQRKNYYFYWRPGAWCFFPVWEIKSLASTYYQPKQISTVNESTSGESLPGRKKNAGRKRTIYYTRVPTPLIQGQAMRKPAAIGNSTALEN